MNLEAFEQAHERKWGVGGLAHAPRRVYAAEKKARSQLPPGFNDKRATTVRRRTPRGHSSLSQSSICALHRVTSTPQTPERAVRNLRC